MKKGVPVLLGAALLLLAILLVLSAPRQPEPTLELDTDKEPTSETDTGPPVADQPVIVQDETAVVEEEVVAPEGGFVEGFAFDEEGNGIRDVKVTASVWTGGLERMPPVARPRTEGLEWNAETNEGGHYRVDRIEAEVVDVKFSHERYLTTWLPEILLGATGADVVMKRRGTISGFVLEKATGEPIADFAIAVGFAYGGPGGKRLGSGGWSLVYNFRDPERFHSETGEFTLTPDHYGKVALRGSAWGYGEGTVSDIEVNSGKETHDVVIRLPRAASIRGTVAADATSEPVAGAKVSFRSSPTARRGLGLQAQTGHDGSFVIVDLAEGKYLIDVEHPDFAPSSTVILDLEEGEEEHVAIRLESGGTIAGFVRVNGRPGPGLKIKLHIEGRTGFAATDEDGYYEITSLAVGRYRLEVTRGKETKWATGWVESSHTTQRDFEFWAGDAIIEGYVTVNGVPVGKGAASVGADPGTVLMHGFSRTARTDEDGFYRIDELAGDTYLVGAEVPGVSALAAALVDLADGETARVDLNVRTGTGSITGTASWPEGFRFPTIMVRDVSDTQPLSVENVVAVGAQIVGATQCNADGIFELADLPAGSYNVTALCFIELNHHSLEDIIQVSKIVTVEEGEVAEVSFAL